MNQMMKKKIINNIKNDDDDIEDFNPCLKENNKKEDNQFLNKEKDFLYNYNNYNDINNKNQWNNSNNKINNNINEFNNFNSNEYCYNNNLENSKNRNENKINAFKRKNIGDNSVNLAELNKKSTEKISKSPFLEDEQRQDFYLDQKEEENNQLNEIDNNYNFQQEENNYIPNENEENDINELNANLREDNIQEKNNIVEKGKIYYKVNNKPKTDIKTNFNYSNNIINNNNKKINNYSNLNRYKNQEILKKNYNDFIFDKNKNIFYSLEISPNIPTNISDFGKFLISHIENEENYKILFYRELKSFKLKIKKIFSLSNSSDHCLTDYLLDLWEKIDISFYIRYQIMNNIIKLNANDLYIFLDRETEYLTNYFQISEQIFDMIKKRENIKAKLQAKNNRNEIILEKDRESLDEITQKLEEDIKLFKNNYKGMNIIWKGIYYEWFMNYEKWFYDMEIRNDLDYIN